MAIVQGGQGDKQAHLLVHSRVFHQQHSNLPTLLYLRVQGTKGLWNMHGSGVNKLETGVQILEMFQGVDLVLLTKTWHFQGQHLPHVEGFDSLVVAHYATGKKKSNKT
jgi:hypothetical protein